MKIEIKFVIDNDTENNTNNKNILGYRIYDRGYCAEKGIIQGEIIDE